MRPTSRIPPLFIPPRPKPIPGLKRALQVGINYIGTPYTLAGCINDVTNMNNHIKQFFPTCKDFKILTDDTPLKPTKKNILDAISWLITGLKPGEHVLFQYSGHGGLVRDANGDEVIGYDSCIYPCNGTQIEQITDDELRIILADKIPIGCKCFVILDCCHSGSAVDLRYRMGCTSRESIFFQEMKQYAKTNGQVVFLSGCHDVQVAADTVNKDNIPCGALTWALIETWKTYGPVIKLKYMLWDILQFLRVRGYSQVPQLTLGQYVDLNTVFDLTKA